MQTQHTDAATNHPAGLYQVGVLNFGEWILSTPIEWCEAIALRDGYRAHGHDTMIQGAPGNAHAITTW